MLDLSILNNPIDAKKEVVPTLLHENDMIMEDNNHDYEFSQLSNNISKLSVLDHCSMSIRKYGLNKSMIRTLSAFGVESLANMEDSVGSKESINRDSKMALESILQTTKDTIKKIIEWIKQMVMRFLKFIGLMEDKNKHRKSKIDKVVSKAEECEPQKKAEAAKATSIEMVSVMSFENIKKLATAMSSVSFPPVEAIESQGPYMRWKNANMPKLKDFVTEVVDSDNVPRFHIAHDKLIGPPATLASLGYMKHPEQYTVLVTLFEALSKSLEELNKTHTRYAEYILDITNQWNKTYEKMNDRQKKDIKKQSKALDVFLKTIYTLVQLTDMGTKHIEQVMTLFGRNIADTKKERK